MKYAWLSCLFVGSLLFAGPAPQDPDTNINARYTVETVILTGKGWTTNLSSETTNKISTSLRHKLTAIIGQKLNPNYLDTLAENLKRELSAREVTHRIVPGEAPEQVRVEFEVRPARAALGMNVDQFVYDSKQGWSGGGEAELTLQQQHTFGLGLVSNGDWLTERDTGITARYEAKSLANDRVSFKFVAQTFHTQWDNRTSQLASANPEATPLYRTREEFQPTATVVLARPLTLTIGTRIERFQPEAAGAPMLAANAIIGTLAYHWEMEGSAHQQDLDADMSVRTAPRFYANDFIYTLRSAGVRYQYRKGRHTVTDNAWAGVISGRAPLSDRFVLGNTYYLRGWNKYEIDPLGGNRALHNSVEYHYGPFQTFYDLGSVWDEGQPVVARHSVGIGVRESIFSLAVAIPLRSGHVEPIFMMGILP